jgi:TolB-like protein
MQYKWKLLTLLGSIFISACTGSIVQHSAAINLNPATKIAVIPFSNYTETPLAGERAMSITAAELQSFGMRNILVYQNRMQGKILFPGMNKVESQKTLMQWARSAHAQYVLTGSVNEWSYKVGLDGEPVVGVEMQLIDLASRKTIWTAVASKSGGSRIAVSTVAQEVIDLMIKGLSHTQQTYVR